MKSVHRLSAKIGLERDRAQFNIHFGIVIAYLLECSVCSCVVSKFAAYLTQFEAFPGQIAFPRE